MLARASNAKDEFSRPEQVSVYRVIRIVSQLFNNQQPEAFFCMIRCQRMPASKALTLRKFLT
jgi:hypothetical protein